MINHSKPMAGSSEIKEVSRILKSGNHATKDTVRKFEEALSSFIGMRGGVAANSGRSALHIALLALGIGEGDEVIIPSFVCTAVLNAVNLTGARARLADIDDETSNMDYRSAKGRMTKKTKAIIIPHMFGLAIDIKPFLGMGVYIIEDCAQSLGAKIDGKRVGSRGHVSIFSFYATKVISTGYGGMMLSNSDSILEKARDLLNFDNRDDYKMRFNYNMTDLQAAMGIVQLGRLGGFIEKRKRIASYYDKRFTGLPLRLPPQKGNIYYRYIIRPRRDIAAVISGLSRLGVEAKRPVFKPLHRYLGLGRGGFAATEKVFKESVSIPIYPALKTEERVRVADAVIKMTGDKR